jgi:peptidyl-tRNA hydrolase
VHLLAREFRGLADDLADALAAHSVAAFVLEKVRLGSDVVPGLGKPVDVLDEDFGEVIATEAGPTAICLPPRRRSEREPQLVELVPFTDAKRPAEVSDPPAGTLVYVIRRGVLRSMGKAIAQAGHAALGVADQMSVTYSAELARWRAQGMAGEVRLADERTWERLKAEVDCVVIRDAGFTQVAPGTETVLGIPPCGEQPSVVRGLERVM